MADPQSSKFATNVPGSNQTQDVVETSLLVCERSNVMSNLQSFFSRSFRPFYLVTGAGTALIGVFAFFPSWATQTIAKLPFLVDYTIIIQHWGIMVFLMGLFMMGAAVFLASDASSLIRTAPLRYLSASSYFFCISAMRPR